MGSITSYSKQIVVFFIALSLFIRPTFASSVGGWSMGNPIAQGASAIYEGSRNVIINGADYVKNGTAKITPTAANVAKTLGKGVAGVAVSVAVEQLLGAVDWVLDPANNQVVYYVDPPIEDPATFPTGYAQSGWDSSKPLECFSLSSCESYASANAANWGLGWVLNGSCTQKSTVSNISCPLKQISSTTTATAEFLRYVNPAYNPEAEQAEREKKTLPLDAVAQQVITNAESATDPQKKAAAQTVTLGAAADIVAEAEADSVKARPIAQQLGASATTKPADQAVADKAAEAQGTAKPNEANPQATDLSLEFPAFCGWAPTVCEFAQTAIQSIADVKAEYADKPQENTDTELEIPDLEQDIEVETDITFGGSCPAPLTTQVNFMGINETIEFSFQDLCEIAQFIKPVVITVSAFSAALIVAGIRTEDD